MRTASMMTSDEIAQETIKQLRAENAALKELHIMQLAAVSTATVQNTETAIKDRIAPDNSYYTTAYGDTCRAVDREMRLRAENAALRAALEKHENAARENLISARIIEAENKGKNYGIARDARFILERTQAALAVGGAR